MLEESESERSSGQFNKRSLLIERIGEDRRDTRQPQTTFSFRQLEEESKEHGQEYVKTGNESREEKSPKQKIRKEKKPTQRPPYNLATQERTEDDVEYNSMEWVRSPSERIPDLRIVESNSSDLDQKEGSPGDGTPSFSPAV